VVICGASSQYNGNLNVGTVRGPSEYLKLAEKGAQMIGFNVMFYFHRLPGAMMHILWLMFRGKIFMTEQLERGVEAFAPAMIKMFTGGHIGKLLVEIGPPRPSSEGTGEASKKIV
jgi:NADPH-dependent curcumin reductase